MNMSRFYNTYNLSEGKLASICGVSKQLIYKYEMEDPTLNEKIKDKIKKVVFVIEKCKLHYPPIDNDKRYFGRMSRFNRVRHDIYVANVQHLCEKVEA